jgi:hypothetical protein
MFLKLLAQRILWDDPPPLGKTGCKRKPRLWLRQPTICWFQQRADLIHYPYPSCCAHINMINHYRTCSNVYQQHEGNLTGYINFSLMIQKTCTSSFPFSLHAIITMEYLNLIHENNCENFNCGTFKQAGFIK